MSGEILGRSQYFSEYGGEEYDVVDRSERKAVIKEDAPTHSFYHDLESLFWVLFWICVCRGGPALRRADLFDKNDPVNKRFRSFYISLFSVVGNDQLASNKALVIENWREFEKKVMAVSDWCWPLRSLLRNFIRILRKHYEEKHFPENEIYEAFISALEESERSIIADSMDPTKKTQPSAEEIKAYNAEVERRAQDCRDWKIPVRTLPEPNAILEANEEPLHSSDEAHPPVARSRPDDSHEKPPLRPLEDALEALHLVPGPPSSNSSESAGSAQTATGKQREKSPASKHSHSSNTPQSAVTSLAAKPQTAKAPSTKVPTNKGAPKKAQAAPATSVAQSTGVLTRAMKRAALAVASSSTTQSRPRGASDTASKKAGPSRSAGRTLDASDEARGTDSTRATGRRVVAVKETRAPGRRTKGKAPKEEE